MKIFSIKPLLIGNHIMNRNDFISMINKPASIEPKSIGEIKELVDFFPYFQSAHLLLLKVLNDTSDVKFPGQLLTSSVHVADREVLYYLLNTERVVETDFTLPSVQLEKSADEAPEDDLDFELDTSPTDFQLIASLNPEEDVTVSTTELLNFEYVPDLIEKEDITDIKSENLQEYKHPDEEKKEEKISQADLMDRFILANPRIEPSREKIDHPLIDVSIVQTEEKQSFITETLAKIYINQEYYSRAIDIYEKLCLKFPEKSSYFASQIEKVKELIKLK